MRDTWLHCLIFTWLVGSFAQTLISIVILCFPVVKALEELKSNGGCDENIDTLLVGAEKRALEKLNSASKGPSRALPHSQLVGGMAGPHDIKPTGITGSGLVLNALTTSRGLSQLVSSVTPSDHSYSSILSGLPGTSTTQFKPELSVTQPSIMKSSVRSSLVALSSSLRGGGQPLSLSTSTTVGTQTQTRNAIPFAVGQQRELQVDTPLFCTSLWAVVLEQAVV